MGRGQARSATELTADLIRLKVDVVFAFGTQAALAANSIAKIIPVIFYTHADPVEAGFATSLARPGGALTGLTLMAPQLVGKRLALLKEAIPSASSVAVLVNTANRGMQSTLRHLGGGRPVSGGDGANFGGAYARWGREQF